MPGPSPGKGLHPENAARRPDGHQRLITYIADALGPHLRPRYHARIGERVYITRTWCWMCRPSWTAATTTAATPTG